MPEYLRTAGYKIYFWSNETDEPIHFHISRDFAFPSLRSGRYVRPSASLHTASGTPSAGLPALTPATFFYTPHEFSGDDSLFTKIDKVIDEELEKLGFNLKEKIRR